MNSYSNSKRTIQANGTNFSARQYFKDNLRVLRRNLLFCSGLPLTLTEAQLKSQKYFGKYGRVLRITQLKNMRQMSVYVTYSDAYQASLAIIATNDFELDRYHKLAAIYGTIKYCKYFLKKIECKNLPNCNYLHVYDKKNQIYINNQLPDEVFEQHYAIAMRVFSGVDVKMLIKEKRLKANNQTDDQLPCPIETLQHIVKQRKHYLSENKSDSSQEYEMTHRKSSDDEESEQQSFSSASQHSSEQEKDSESQQGTSETIALETIQKQSNEQFPKLGIERADRGKKQRYREKSSTLSKKPQSQNNSLAQSPQNLNKTSVDILQNSPLSSVPKMKLSFSENSETLQIKIIRRLLREPKSKLHEWRGAQKQQQQPNTQVQVQLFHKQLSQLNQLRELFENNILREKSREQQRVKFLLIKNIHYNKKHYHLPHHHNKITKTEEVVQ